MTYRDIQHLTVDVLTMRNDEPLRRYIATRSPQDRVPPEVLSVITKQMLQKDFSPDYIAGNQDNPFVYINNVMTLCNCLFLGLTTYPPNDICFPLFRDLTNLLKYLNTVHEEYQQAILSFYSNWSRYKLLDEGPEKNALSELLFDGLPPVREDQIDCNYILHHVYSQRVRSVELELTD